MEYGVKAGYAKAIGAASGATLGRDELTLRFATPAPPALIGAIDPRFKPLRRTADGLTIVEAPRYAVFSELLAAEGVAPERFAHVHAPIGLDLGAVTPQEIAVSIVAELIAVRRGRADVPSVASASLKWMPKFNRSAAGG